MGPLRRGKGGAGGGAGGEGEGRSSSLGQGPPRAGCRGRQGGGEALHNPEPASRRSLEGRPPRQPYRHRHRHPAKLTRSKSVASFPPAGDRVSPATLEITPFSSGGRMEFTRHFVHQLGRSLDKVRVVGRGSEGEREPFEPARTGRGGLSSFSSPPTSLPTPLHPFFPGTSVFLCCVFWGSGDFKGPS